MKMKILTSITFGVMLISSQPIKAEMKNSEQLKKDERIFDDQNNNLSVYTGTFDVIDKEGDDKTSLLGVEHKNTDLFRDTLIGTFTPITGAFITGKNSTYLYTGIEGQYKLGPVRILPSFSPFFILRLIVDNFATILIYLFCQFIKLNITIKDSFTNNNTFNFFII